MIERNSVMAIPFSQIQLRQHFNQSLQVLIFTFLTTTQQIFCTKTNQNSELCNQAPSCGNIHNISHPFRLKDQPEFCGEPEYELLCENNKTMFLLNSHKYHVKAINRSNFTIRLVDAAIRSNDCSSLPRHSLTYTNFTIPGRIVSPVFFTMSVARERGLWRGVVLFLSCKKPLLVRSTASFDYIKTEPCVKSNKGRFSYVMFGNRAKVSDLDGSCRVIMMMVHSKVINCRGNCSYQDVHDILAYGFELSWRRVSCQSFTGDEDVPSIVRCSKSCDVAGIDMCKLARFMKGLFVYVGIFVFLVLRFFVGLLLLAALLIYKWRTRHESMYNIIEEFLQTHNNFKPIKYSFSDIKKMTKGFKDKLGEGGFGSVYKGKLRSGCDVAVKVLGKSKADGQDFINEVSTIGRIHHVNIVHLYGFCVQDSVCSLVYEFMPNGSLEKYLFSNGDRDNRPPLSYEKMHEISLGVARGIEYLHRGCDMRILHLDIKPHNVLLDGSLTPKISDFGLAKLYSLEDSIVPLTAAVGTIGYIAPELVYKSIGAISNKADVYSFGMLLMDMAGRRKRFSNEAADCSNQIYFNSWVYDQISKGKSIVEVEEVDSDEERAILKKMVIVALWCIQTKPSQRPSMSKVIEMLEGDIEGLQVPPKPSLYPQNNDTTTSLSSFPLPDSVDSSVGA